MLASSNTYPFSTLPQVQVLNPEGTAKAIQLAPCLALVAQLLVLALSVL